MTLNYAPMTNFVYETLRAGESLNQLSYISLVLVQSCGGEFELLYGGEHISSDNVAAPTTSACSKRV